MSSLANNAVDHNESTIIRIYSGNAKRTAKQRRRILADLHIHELSRDRRFGDLGSINFY